VGDGLVIGTGGGGGGRGTVDVGVDGVFGMGQEDRNFCIGMYLVLGCQDSKKKEKTKV
jgi:hypothetical protein